MILAFIAGLGLAGLGAFFMLRRHKSSAAPWRDRPALVHGGWRCVGGL